MSQSTSAAESHAVEARNDHPQQGLTTLPLTTAQLVEQAAEQYGDALFLEEHDTRISFKEFAERVRQVAAALIENGIQPGDRAAIWSPNISEWVIAALGAQYAGAILVTLNTRYKGEEASYILRKSGTRLLFSIDRFIGVDYPSQLDLGQLTELKKIVLFRSKDSAVGNRHQAKCCQQSWETFLQSGQNINAEQIHQRMSDIKGDAISDILFTSGTTGEPKGVMTSHQQNLRAFTYFANIVGFCQGDRYLVINPFFHSFGYKAGILSCLLKGVTLLPHAVFDSEQILQRIANDRISVLPGPPTLFQSLLAHPHLEQYDLSSLQRATTGAAVVPLTLIEQMKSRLGFKTIITAYGLTESCGLVTACRQQDSAETIATTSGRAIPEIELRCVDHNNRPVASGETGEIVVRGFNVMQGYFENDRATRDAIDREGWLHTGDIGVLDAQGNLKITDRLKDMFISGGFNCYPAEIEKAIAEHQAIAMNAVIGVADQRMGEVAKAYVVLKPDQQLDADELISWCRQRMANFKVPRQVEFMDALPMNASGKVLKNELRHPLP